MPLNPSIPLSYKPPEPYDFQSARVQAITLRGLLQRQKMQQMEIDAEQRKQQDGQTVQQVMGEVGGDYDKAILALSGKVHPDTIYGLQKSRRETQDYLRKQRKEDLENNKLTAERLGTVALGIRDPDTLISGLDKLRNEGHITDEERDEVLLGGWNQEMPGKIKSWIMQSDTARKYYDEELTRRGEEERKAAVEARAAALAGPQLEKATADASLAKIEAAQGGKATQHPITIKHPTTGQPVPAIQRIMPDGSAKVLLAGQEVPNPVEYREPKADTGAAPVEETAIDSNSKSILSQTGLSLPAFYVLTGRSSQLARDRVTRTRAMTEAEQFANKRGVDVSTLGKQYEAYNTVLASNISRMSFTTIMENELQGTIQNLQKVANDKDFGKLRAKNVIDIWWGKQVNDNLAQQYALHLSQLRNELSAYYAATQGRTGNNITEKDQRDADAVIAAGIAKGSLEGMATAISNSTEKMSTVMTNSVKAAEKAVWDLFGVGKNYGKNGANGSTPKDVIEKLSTEELLRRLAGAIK
jgi:hypothetical protein